MSHRSCCVVNCKNTNKNKQCKFYSFPTAKWKLNQRKKWIAAVRRKNADGSPWNPKAHDHICSDHFIGGKKSKEESSPSYVPTIFPLIYKSSKVNESLSLSRHERFMERRIKKKLSLRTATTNMDTIGMEFIEVITENPPDVILKIDQECQVDFHSTSDVNSQTFICNRFVNDGVCVAETQSEIVEDTRSIKSPNKKKMVDKECGTPHKSYVDQETQANSKGFTGFASIDKNEQLTDLAGVTLEPFEFLLKRMPCAKCVLSRQDRLLIFLMKMKTGLTFAALSALFNVHRTTISRTFFEILQHLAGKTRNLVFWPSIDAVQETMPECFHPKYSNTRVIIDCTEFKIQIPSSVDNRVFTYSHYKKSFTAKVLIGITPGGFISFKSKVAGGRKSDSQITIDSGLLDLLEEGDVVLADKGFPEIKTVIDSSGKKVQMVMPPFLEKKSEFSTAETQETYSVASVRIHVERIMQRLRTYQILHKIPENLFHCIDDIMHMCCVLVNLQPPIFASQEIQ